MTCDNARSPISCSKARAYESRSGRTIDRDRLNMTLSIRVITTEEDFAALAGVWKPLVARAADANTFLTHDWLYSWWRSYRPAAQLKIVLAERAGALLGIAPMMIQREGGVERALRRLRFVGDGTSETDHMNFIVAAERAGDRARGLARGDRSTAMGRGLFQPDAAGLCEYIAVAGTCRAPGLVAGPPGRCLPASPVAGDLR